MTLVPLYETLRERYRYANVIKEEITNYQREGERGKEKRGNVEIILAPHQNFPFFSPMRV